MVNYLISNDNYDFSYRKNIHIRTEWIIKVLTGMFNLA